MIPTRDEAEKLLHEFTQSDALIKHALAVEGVMRHYAAKQGEDVEYWGVVGLLHDLDYERYPEQHCTMVRQILGERGVDEDMIHAICSHGYGLCSDVEPERYMEKVLYAIDELTGLINACALMRPSHSVMDMESQERQKEVQAAQLCRRRQSRRNRGRLPAHGRIAGRGDNRNAGGHARGCRLYRSGHGAGLSACRAIYRCA